MIRTVEVTAVRTDDDSQADEDCDRPPFRGGKSPMVRRA